MFVLYEERTSGTSDNDVGICIGECGARCFNVRKVTNKLRNLKKRKTKYDVGQTLSDFDTIIERTDAYCSLEKMVPNRIMA